MAWKNKTEKDKFEFLEYDDTLTGKIIAFKPMHQGGLVYDMITEEGDLVYFFGSTQLDSILPELKGQMVRIVYKGKKKLERGREIREYIVNVWEDESESDEPPAVFQRGDSNPDDEVPF